METPGYKFYQELIALQEDGDIELALANRAGSAVENHLQGAKDLLNELNEKKPTLENIIAVAGMIQKEILISSLIYAIQNKQT